MGLKPDGLEDMDRRLQAREAQDVAGHRLPSFTTTQRDAIAAPVAGLLIFNSTTSKVNFWNGAAWAAVTSV